MPIEKSVLEFMQARLGYTDEELALFAKDPRNEEILAKVPELMAKTIVATVVDSHGCNSQHKVGDQLFFDAAGNLLTKKGPSRICIYALASFAGAVHSANELFYAGVDPNQMRFKRVGCHDVGVRCGGWGKVVMEFSMQDRAVLK